ncbi:hypothetical protein NIES592_05200 [Fischerella major NIES-592]|uniref:Uncharacterized protein n=2 Tax=Fischerella TaxID=1190 RepID=A0A1U7H2W7_9CYAN|nr:MULTISPECIES: hypothetical protein [Fischerella]OKH15492.1 hypothetical protein NIES592_05200 [Fischerella major NIES-592]PMB46118.1 hypothetical protein CEN41_06630 [Fischerella thermalis CCMEE 5330]BAU04380.1 hypothetical protein FIS3754_02670 [Fischerella sp. NIES-3754]BCX06816.1 MAG: hypothetical protein KatS3mg066_0675 [Fischerella sp.]
MEKYLSISRSIPILIVASFGLIASPDVAVLAATGKFNPEPNSIALDVLSETELDNLNDTDAAYVRAIREHFD